MSRPLAPIKAASLDFDSEGTPRSAAYDDRYHSCEGPLAQAQFVFLGGNGLPVRWAGRERFVVLETGFGLGLNFLATWRAWRDDPARCETSAFRVGRKAPVRPV
jgi:tRNA 5-methylaminomethyl-2-thiouridine biosynthesis bifunctional protein